MRFIFQALTSAVGFWASSRFIPGVHAYGLGSLLAAGFILGVVNVLVRPILVLLTIPLTIVTFGLFLFFVNGLTVWLTAALLHGVQIDTLWAAILTAFVITVISWVTRAVLAPE
jgi:putative membrane protein